MFGLALALAPAGVPAGLAAGRGPVDGDPGAVGERRPAEDPRQVAVDGAAAPVDDGPGAGAAAGAELLGAVPHLRRGVPGGSGRPRLRPGPAVLPPRGVPAAGRHLPVPPQQHPGVPVLRGPPGDAVPQGELQGPRGAGRVVWVRHQHQRQQLHVKQRRQHVEVAARARPSGGRAGGRSTHDTAMPYHS